MRRWRCGRRRILDAILRTAHLDHHLAAGADREGLCPACARCGSPPAHRGRGRQARPLDAGPRAIPDRPAEERERLDRAHSTSMREARPTCRIATPEEDALGGQRSLAAQEVARRAQDARRRCRADGEMLAQLYILPTRQARFAAACWRNVARLPKACVFASAKTRRGLLERRGFVAIEFGDGGGKEVPDVRYQWTPPRPCS